jgi:hypothetical protein
LHGLIGACFITDHHCISHSHCATAKTAQKARPAEIKVDACLYVTRLVTMRTTAALSVAAGGVAMANDDRILNQQQVANLCGVSPGAVRYWVKRGWLPP